VEGSGLSIILCPGSKTAVVPAGGCCGVVSGGRFVVDAMISGAGLTVSGAAGTVSGTGAAVATAEAIPLS
jgi:hypothetical protein